MEAEFCSCLPHPQHTYLFTFPTALAPGNKDGVCVSVKTGKSKACKARIYKRTWFEVFALLIGLLLAGLEESGLFCRSLSEKDYN